jgi:hypothetical protein
MNRKSFTYLKKVLPTGRFMKKSFELETIQNLHSQSIHAIHCKQYQIRVLDH